MSKHLSDALARVAEEEPPHGVGCDYKSDPHRCSCGRDQRIVDRASEYRLLLWNNRAKLVAALRWAESVDHRGEWANLSEDAECCSCGATIADEDGELTQPHGMDCPFVAYRDAVRKGGD